MTPTRDDDVFGGEPRIDGTRIVVRHVATRVIDSGQSPAHVADQLDVPTADVYEALSCYYGHLDEMREFEAGNEATFECVRETSLEPKETVQRPGHGFCLKNSSVESSNDCSESAGTTLYRRKTGSVNVRVMPNCWSGVVNQVPSS